MYHRSPLCPSVKAPFSSELCLWGSSRSHLLEPESPDSERSSFSAVLAKLGGKYPLDLAHHSAGEVCSVSDLSPQAAGPVRTGSRG